MEYDLAVFDIAGQPDGVQLLVDENRAHAGEYNRTIALYTPTATGLRVKVQDQTQAQWQADPLDFTPRSLDAESKAAGGALVSLSHVELLASFIQDTTWRAAEPATVPWDSVLHYVATVERPE